MVKCNDIKAQYFRMHDWILEAVSNINEHMPQERSKGDMRLVPKGNSNAKLIKHKVVQRLKLDESNNEERL